MAGYADTSLLVSLYVRDPNSGTAASLVRRRAEALPFTPLHALELRNALRLCVFRKDIRAAAGRTALRLVEVDLEQGVLVATPLPWSEALAAAEQLSVSHTARLGCWSLDVLHVASAITLGSRELLSFDRRQRRLARRAGLRVVP